MTDPSSISVRRLAPGDEATLREIRLQALSDDPEAFGSSYDREADRSDADWQRWFRPGAAFIAEHPDEGAVGLVAGYPDQHDASIAYLVSMWIRETHRGTGVADKLVEAVLAWSLSHGVTTLRLTVIGGNIRASKLYVRHGFYPTGETNVRARDGAIEIEMQRDDPGPTTPTAS